SNMPAFPWLATRMVNPALVQKKMRVLRELGTPYTAEQIARVPDAVGGKSELDALIAYLQGLGTDRSGKR
ncbi:MAG: cytochrome-c oxidase, cbb3-type subunit II, partial [Gammaproteobacteria bacterium]